jgi:protein-disulfide isomerase
MKTRVSAWTLVLWGVLGPLPSARAGAPTDEAVALVGGMPITVGQLEKAVQGSLMELRMREYELRSEALDELISQNLLEAEAARRGMTLPALLRAEVDERVSVTEAELKAVYQNNKDRFPGKMEAEALGLIEPALTQQRRRERRAVFVGELRSKAAVRVLLPPLRVAVDPGGGAARGSPAAKVTIVEFSDFQCPYCARARPTIERIEKTYRDRVRIVYRDFPLPIHPQAAKAAEAGACARDQGKFWEMHDRIFENQARLEVADLKRFAGELGLEARAFETCLDSGTKAAGWKRDLEEATGYGVSATPAFFINGRPLVGAQPYERFAHVIDEELEASSLTPPAKKE